MTFAMRYYGTDLQVSVGKFVDGRPAEVFVNGGKIGTDVESLMRDNAILISIALQHGVPLEELCYSVSRETNGRPQSFVGALLDAMKGEHK